MVEWGKPALVGGYFKALISSEHDSDWHWALTPFVLIWLLFGLLVLIFLFKQFFIPHPRRALPSEKRYKTLDRDGTLTESRQLPCWMDRALEQYTAAKEKGEKVDVYKLIEPPEVEVTVIVPAYNEAQRLAPMLEETVNLLQQEFGVSEKSNGESNGDVLRHRRANTATKASGWEVLLVNDGSTDGTVTVCETFTRSHLFPARPRRQTGPWTPNSHTHTATSIPPDSIRMITLAENRGKGGAVTHGMRHARGQYVLFADADGASDIKDLPNLIAAAKKHADESGRGIAVGSRAHMVSSPTVVQRSALRNFLMHSFHLLLRVLTPPRTARIKDTQCGFKLFTRPTLPYIVPHMHMEGWIFDVEMLMLAEFSDIPVVEVPIGWKEVNGSKLNVIWDSVGMAWNLALLRFCWATGIYR